MKLCSTLLLNFARSEKVNVDSVEKPLPEEYAEVPNDRFFGSFVQSAVQSIQNAANDNKYFGRETCSSQFYRLRNRDDCMNKGECGEWLTPNYTEACRKCQGELSTAAELSNSGTDNRKKTWRNAYFDDGFYKYGKNKDQKQNVIYFTDYGNNAHCYHKFASECKYGVNVRIKEMRIEARPNECPYDYIAFGFERNGQKFYPGKQQRFCGCLESHFGSQCEAIKRGHDSFDITNIFTKTGCAKFCWSPWKQYWTSSYHSSVTNDVRPSFDTTSRLDRKNKWIAINGRNPTLTFKSDASLHGGEIAMEWDCMSEATNRWIVKFNIPALLEGNPRRQGVSRTTIVNDINQALQNSMQLINPYGDTAETKLKVRLSEDETEFITELEFNGIRDESVVLDAATISRQVSETSKATLSTDQFNQHVDAANIKVKVQAPPTVTNTEQMANKLLTGNFKPPMAENYGCSSRGYFDAFGPTNGKPRDATDAAFYKWKKCVQCASGNDKNQIAPYDYDESEKVCRGENRAFCECDLALMTHLKSADPYKGDFDVVTCNAADHQAQLNCCNWQQHFWAAYNPDRQDCDEIEGVKEAGSL